jgi:hypothetical protein
MSSLSLEAGLDQKTQHVTSGMDGPARSLAFASSILIHLAFALLLLRPLALRMPTSGGRTESWLRSSAVMVVPPAEPKADQRQSIRRRSGRPSSSSPPLVAPAHEATFNGIQIAVLPDHQRQLLPILRRFNGRIALAKSESPRHLVETFRAVDFQPAGPTSLEGWLAFRLWDPEAWPELVPLVRQCSDNCIVYALFNVRYKWLLLRAASSCAQCQPLNKVVLRLRAALPLGAEVVSVECANGENGRQVCEASNVLMGEGWKQ